MIASAASTPIEPADLGFPDYIRRWRKGQFPAITRGLESAHAYTCEVIPTGGGKSAVYVALALLSGGKTFILTSTKALQDQLERDFGHLDLVVVKGRSNYDCTRRRGLNCDEGAHAKCPIRHSDSCPAKAAVTAAREADITVSNYAHFATVQRYGTPFTGIDLLVLDESHNLLDELANIENISIRIPMLHEISAKSDVPPVGNMGRWQEYARLTARRAEQIADKLALRLDMDPDPDVRLVRTFMRWKRLHQALAQIGAISDPESWVMERIGGTVSFDPVWPLRAAGILFGGIPKIYLTSATVTEETLEMCGITEYAWHAQRSNFAAERSPFYLLPTLRVDHRATEGQLLKLWLHADWFGKPRLDMGRKGIVHTVSYERAKQYLANSRLADYAISHKSRQLADAVDDYIRAEQARMLVSPVVTTGYNFPDDLCRWQVMLKVPFPDTRSPLMKARVEQRPLYRYWYALMSLEQMHGRGMRGEKDWCESILFDSHAEYLFGSRYRRMISTSFQRQVRWIDTLPKPLLASRIRR